MHDIDRLVAGIAPDPGPGRTPLAGELLEEITSLPPSEPGPRRRWPAMRRGVRRWVAVPVLAVLTAALSFGVAQAPASAALDIELVDGHYVIMVNDLMADPEVYEAELRARGLDIALRLVPTSASLTGQMFVINDLDLLRSGEPVPAEGPIATIDGPGPCRRLTGCPIGLKVPVDFDKKAKVTLGRRARPGERYKMPPGIAMYGEPLHCVAYINKTVAEIRTILLDRGVTPSFISPGQGSRPSAPGDWFVHDGVMAADGQALLLVGPERRAWHHPPQPGC